MYRLKALIRWLRFQMRFGITYDAYQQGGAAGYAGWYEARGKCIAFRDLDGGIQYRW